MCFHESTIVINGILLSSQVSLMLAMNRFKWNVYGESWFIFYVHSTLSPALALQVHLVGERTALNITFHVERKSQTDNMSRCTSCWSNLSKLSHEHYLAIEIRNSVKLKLVLHAIKHLSPKFPLIHNLSSPIKNARHGMSCVRKENICHFPHKPTNAVPVRWQKWKKANNLKPMGLTKFSSH